MEPNKEFHSAFINSANKRSSKLIIKEFVFTLTWHALSFSHIFLRIYEPFMQPAATIG